MAARCDHQCVGVVIPDGDTVWLLERGTPPPGWAGVGGHLDHHGSPEQAARAETKEEMGLTGLTLISVFEEWLPNWCRREPQPGTLGHRWHMFIATWWEGTPTASPPETRAVRRFHQRELQVLAERAAAYAVGEVTPADFAAKPGLELPWVYWAYRLGLVDLPGDVLGRIVDRSALSPTAPRSRGRRHS
ncbi:NUDIX domain-containing protein [Nonomuraea wenchangensis]